MQSTFVLGIGGLGKWTITHFKDRMIDLYGGLDDIPNNIQWLALDIQERENPPVQLLRYSDGRAFYLEPDFDKKTFRPDFYNFENEDNCNAEILKIQNDNNVDPRLNWLSRSDANQYVFRQGEHGAAGERRQISRINMIVNSGEIYKEIEGKVNSIDDRALIVVVNSIAGGTGCGAFLDFALLLKKAIEKRQNQKTKIDLFHVLVLPAAFEPARAGQGEGQMYQNCAAAWREYSRLNYKWKMAPINYKSGDLTLGAVKKPELSNTLFDLWFIVDGTTIKKDGKQVRHWDGIAPAISDFIVSLAATQVTTDDTSSRNLTVAANAWTGINKNFNVSNSSPDAAAVHSSLGDYRYIFDTKLVKEEFAQKISQRILDHFLEQYPKGSAVNKILQDFLRQGSTNFDAKLVAGLTGGGQVEKKNVNRLSLISRLEPSDNNIKIDFPHLELKDRVDTATLAKFISFQKTPTLSRINQRVNGLIRKHLGNDDDKANVGDRRPVFMGVINHYREVYTIHFEHKLREEVLRILQEHQGTELYGHGVLLKAKAFIDSLSDAYNFFESTDGKGGVFNNLCDGLENMEQRLKIDVATLKNKIAEYGNKNKRSTSGRTQQKFLAMMQMYLEKMEQQKLQKLVTDIARVNKETIIKMGAQIGSWIYTLNQGKSRIAQANKDLKSVRQDKASVFVRRYITESEDKWEQQLFEIFTEGKNPFPKSTRPYQQWKIDWKAFYSDFTWSLEKNTNRNLEDSAFSDGMVLKLGLPTGMPNWPQNDDWESDNDSILTWNYEFTKNYLEKSSLDKLDQLNIFDILAWQNIDVNELLNEITNHSIPMAAIKPDNNRNKSEDKIIFINSNADYGLNIINKFKQIAKNQGWTISEGGNSEIDAIILERLISSDRFELLAEAKKHYWDHLKKNSFPPIHIFAAEREAAKLEIAFAKKQNKQESFFHPRVVALLERTELVETFFIAKSLNIIKKDSSAKDRGFMLNSTVLGNDLQTSLENLCFETDKPEFIAAYNSMLQTVNDELENINKEEFIKKIKAEAEKLYNVGLKLSKIPKVNDENQNLSNRMKSDLAFVGSLLLEAKANSMK